MFRNEKSTIKMNTMMDSWPSKLCIEIRAGLPESDGHFDCTRIGAPGSFQSRPLKVSFSSKSTAFELLSNSKNLKDDHQYGDVFIVEKKELSTKNLMNSLELSEQRIPKRNFTYGIAV
jgi:hypothetical protein